MVFSAKPGAEKEGGFVYCRLAGTVVGRTTFFLFFFLPVLMAREAVMVLTGML